MCGFACVFYKEPIYIEKKRIDRTLNLLKDRGPDSFGITIFNGKNLRFKYNSVWDKKLNLPSTYGDKILIHTKLSFRYQP